MEELLRLARALRPAVLDDHGLLPALHTQVRDFTEQTGIRATFHRQGAPTRARRRAAARDLPRHAGGPLEHRPARRAPKRVEGRAVASSGARVLRIADDGRGFPRAPDGGLGLGGMRERALLAADICPSARARGRHARRADRSVERPMRTDPDRRRPRDRPLRHAAAARAPARHRGRRRGRRRRRGVRAGARDAARTSASSTSRCRA